MRPGRSALLVGLVVLALSAAARTYRLEADPPWQIVPGYVGHTHFRDEPAKAHEARNRALFGVWKLSEADEYAFWRRQSPVWVYGQSFWFALFGVTYASARLYVIVYALGGLGLLFGLAAARYGVLAAAFATVLMSFNFAYLQYTRLALMEAAVIFYLLASTCALAAAWRWPRRAPVLVPAASVLFLAAWLTKPSGLVLAPLVAGTAVVVVYARCTRGLSAAGRIGQLVRSSAGGGLLAAWGVLLVAAALLFTDREYASRFTFQVREHLGGVVAATPSLALGALLREAESVLAGIARHLVPVSFWFAGAEIIRAVVQLWRGRRAIEAGASPATGEVARRRLAVDAPPDPLAAYMIGWLALALGANLATREHLVHFHLILFPPIALLGGVFAARLWFAGGRARRDLAIAWAWGLRGVVVLAGVLFVVYHGERYYGWAANPTYSFPQSSRALSALIGDRDAVVVGEYAAQVTLETRYRHFYIRPKLFNDSREVLRSLGITHLVAHAEDLVAEVLRRNAPELLERRRRIGEIEFYGLALDVYELDARDHAPQ